MIIKIAILKLIQSTQRAGYLKIIRPMHTTEQEESVYVNDTDDADNVS